jgi:hypothetical protein
MARGIRKPVDKGTITFDESTWVRLRRLCRPVDVGGLGISYVEFIQQAVRHALDECEADLRRT